MSETCIDSVLWAVKDREFETPSAIARRAGMSTGTALAVLTMLAREGLVATEGNGAWTRYRRFR